MRLEKFAYFKAILMAEGIINWLLLRKKNSFPMLPDSRYWYCIKILWLEHAIDFKGNIVSFFFFFTLLPMLESAFYWRKIDGMFESFLDIGREKCINGEEKKSSKNKSLHRHTSQVLISGASSGLIAFGLNGRTEIKQRTE